MAARRWSWAARLGNDTISMLKFTLLVSVLALPDLLYSAQDNYARTYRMA
jgi:polar amino acid transport system permease protein